MPSRQVIAVAYLAVLAWSYTAEGQEQAFDASRPPDDVHCYGLVQDAQNQAIEHAKVSLIQGIYATFDPIFSAISATPIVLTTRTDESGKFQIDLHDEDAFWQANQHNLLFVEAPGFLTSVVKVTNERLLVNGPVTVDLVPGKPEKVRVIDASGMPVVGCKVSVAALGRQIIAKKFSDDLARTTDDQGIVRLDGFSRNNLAQIYVESDNYGNQRIPVREREGFLEAQLLNAGQLSGSIECSEPLKHSADHARIRLVSLAQDNFSLGQIPSLSWAESNIENDGSFHVPVLSRGTVWIRCKPSKDFPFILDDTSSRQIGFDPLKKETLKIKMKAARRVKLQLVTEMSAPIANLDLSKPGGSMSRTDQDGFYYQWVGQGESLDGQLFPFDAFNQFTIEPFGIKLVSLKENSDGKVDPIAVSYADSITGKAIDADGHPVSGAKITCSFGQERFTIQKEATTDLSGNFRVRGLPQNSSFTLTGKKGNLSTDKPHQVPTNTSETDVEIVLVETAVAKLRGRIIDQNGAPVKNAKVSVFRANVTQKEGFSNEDVLPQILEGNEEGCRTNSSGDFETLPVSNFDARFQILVQSPGYRELRSPFRRSADIKNQRCELGVFELLASSEPTAKKIHVTHLGKAIANAEISVLTPFAPRQYGVTNADGLLQLALSSSPTVIAVRAAGHQVKLQFLASEDSDIFVKLDAPGSERPGLSIREKHESYQALAKQIVNKLQFPNAKDSSFYRQMRYFSALATADTERLIAVLSDTSSGFQYREQFALMAFDPIVRNAPEKIIAAIESFSPSADMKANLLASYALSVDDPELQEELFGEAIFASSSLTGEQRYTVTGWLANHLALAGRLEEAKALISECWEEAHDIRAMLKDKRRVHKRAVARVLVPKLAWLDIQTAFDLIDLTADQRESTSLKSQALTYLSQVDAEAAFAISKAKGIELDQGVNSFLNASGTRLVRMSKLNSWLQKVIPELSDSDAKVRALLLSAKFSDSREDRRSAVQAAAECMRTAKVDFWYHWTDPAKKVLEIVPSMADIERDEIGELVFASLCTGPNDFESHNHLTVFANRIRLIALHSPDIASQLIKPIFNDTVWLHQNQRPALDQNQMVGATAWIDPSWAAENLDEIYQQMPQEGIEQLQLYSSLLSDMEQIINLTHTK